jgi:hypothetical protein
MWGTSASFLRYSWQAEALESHQMSNRFVVSQLVLNFNRSEEGRYINTNITFLDVIHRPVLFKTDNVTDTRLCLRLQLGSIDRAGPCLRKVVLNKNRTTNNAQKHNICRSEEVFYQCC